MTRHDEIRKIMREHYIRDLEINATYFLTDEEKDELRRLKRDYYAEPRTDKFALTVPGIGWEIRGPLTVSQIEEKLIESYNESSKRRLEIYGVTEKFEDSETGEVWGRLKGKFKEGDELYFFK